MVLVDSQCIPTFTVVHVIIITSISHKFWLVEAPVGHQTLHFHCSSAVWNMPPSVAHLLDLSTRLNGFAAGMCFGHRKLIQLSPKKTWEGFIGGCITTVVASWYLAGFMSRFKWMTCPRTVRHLLMFGHTPAFETFCLCATSYK